MSASADLGARGMNWSQRLHGASDLSGGSASTAITPVTIKEHSFWKLDSASGSLIPAGEPATLSFGVPRKETFRRRAPNLRLWGSSASHPTPCNCGVTC